MSEQAAPTVFEWHRVEGAVLSSLATGAGILLLGPICGALAFVAFKHRYELELAFAILGAICIVVGPAIAVVKLARSLHEDASLAARSDGVVFERNGKSLHMQWDDIERVEVEPQGALVFRRKSDEPFVLHERFATIATEERQKRLEELRRKASFGLLPKE